jgi:hypothetical protein
MWLSSMQQLFSVKSTYYSALYMAFERNRFSGMNGSTRRQAIIT